MQDYSAIYTKSQCNGVAPNLHFPHLHQTQIYISHIYTEPRFTQTQIYTNPDLHQTQIYTALHWHTQIYTTQIYTKLNPNLHRPKFTQAQIYIHIFGQISSNPNSHDPNLHKTQIYTTQIYATQIYTQPKKRSAGAVYVSNRVRHSNQARRALGSRRPHSNRVSSNRVRQLSQSVCIGVTLSLGWLGSPHSNRV